MYYQTFVVVIDYNFIPFFKVSSKYDSLKSKASDDINALEKSVHELKEEVSDNEVRENEVVPKLQRRIAELETMLEAAEDDAEAQKKLAAELGN